MLHLLFEAWNIRRFIRIQYIHLCTTCLYMNHCTKTTVVCCNPVFRCGSSCMNHCTALHVRVGFAQAHPNKGGQVTKAIIVVKICYKLLHVIQVVKNFLISNFLSSADIKVLVSHQDTRLCVSGQETKKYVKPRNSCGHTSVLFMRPVK